MPKRNAVRALFLVSAILTTSLLSAAGRPLAPPPIEQTSYFAYFPLAAFAGDRFLTIWSEPAGPFGYFMRGAFSDAEGRRISEKSFLIDVPATAYRLAFIGIGDRYVLFQNDQTKVEMLELDRDAHLLARRTVDLPTHVYQKFVWDGAHFVVASVRQGNHVDVHLLDRDGTRLRQPLVLDGGEYRFDATRAGDVVLIAATGRTGTFLHSIRRDGTFGSRILVPTSGTPLTASVAGGPVLAAMPDGRAIAVWSTYHEPNSAIWIQELARGGAPVENPVIAIYGSGYMTAVELARVGDAWVLIYSSSSSPATLPELFATRVAPRSSSDAGHEIGSASALSSAMAFGDRVLFVALQSGTPSSIRSVAVDENAQVLHNDLLSLSPARQLQPALTEVAGRYVAAWSELSGSDRRARSAGVALDGEPVATATLGAQALASRELASNGEEVLALQVAGDALLARRLRLDGVPLDPAPQVLGTITSGKDDLASAVWLRGQWVVVWANDEAIQFATITADGMASRAKSLPLETVLAPGEGRRYSSTALAANGDYALLVWSERHAEVCWFPGCDEGRLHTFATRITPEGEVVDPALKLFEGELPGISVASSGRESFVALGRHARLLDVQSGMLRIAASPELFNWLAASDVTWDGREYAVALRYAGVNWYLATRRFDRAGQEIDTIRGMQTLPAENLAPPGIASATANDSLIAVQEGDAADGMRAVVYRERDLAPLPPPPQSPRNVRVEHISSSVYEVSWDPPPGPAPELYIVETKEDGAWVAITTWSALHVSVYTPYVRVRAFNAGGGSPEIDVLPPPRRRAIAH